MAFVLAGLNEEVLRDGNHVTVGQELDAFFADVIGVHEGKAEFACVFFHVLYIDEALVQIGVDCFEIVKRVFLAYDCVQKRA